MENPISIVISFIIGGGLATMITAISTRNKNKNDITIENIKTAIALKNEAVKEYTTVEEKLREARKLLDEVQFELDTARHYIDVLINILNENDINYPSIEEVSKKEDYDGRHNS